MAPILAHGSLGLLPDMENTMFLMPTLPALLVVTIVVGAALEKRGALGEPGRTVALHAPLAIIVAVLALASAGIHFAVISDHLEVDVSEGVFFFGIAWFQLIWAQVYLLRQSRAVAQLAIVVNTLVVATWLISRTTGLPIGSQPWVPEQVGLPDLLATSFELGVIGLLLPTLSRERFAASLDSQMPVQKAFVLAAFTVVAVGLLTALALVPPAFEFLAF